ncbi:D-hexose-6-phosphate mutarotase [Marinomonas sp. 15G1-11]|uniref:Putative glucose-6-phosphate 1-epimerase n=1 Tax=Marinomonas phaeophyticola TaxID=3004091 RepID=A0ABT4JZ43_9GAMM|nr:D-hexose-6-phosphate mutarotase [Marinomonas sp. 15G1-11]MCZ2723667.1 D-hexose-6-phosphate mutarotase [Marinomonas sp. 15G1-11]
MDHQLINELEAIGGEIRASSFKGCDEILIEQPGFSARIALWGGHLSSFMPNGEPDILFQSSHDGSDTRFSRKHFGVPVCWPWFGANVQQPDLPAHGLARYFRWELEEVGRFKNGDIKVVIKLESEKHPLIEDMWPQAFELKQVFRLGDGFQVKFSAANLSNEPIQVSEALHTYFRVGDSALAVIKGLDKTEYEDKFAGGRHRQTGTISPCVYLDRVYLDAEPMTYLEDPVLGRRISIETEGTACVVVWNPGEELAKERNDMNDEDYQSFVCVESANALENAHTVGPREIYHFKMKIKSERLK